MDLSLLPLGLGVIGILWRAGDEDRVLREGDVLIACGDADQATRGAGHHDHRVTVTDLLEYDRPSGDPDPP